VVAVDGKTLRGSGVADEPGRHLLAALDHADGVILGQVDVHVKTNEIPMFPTLRTASAWPSGGHRERDARPARPRAVPGSPARGALPDHHQTQPARLHAPLAGLPWRQIPVVDIQHDRAHGRAKRRALKVTAVAAGLFFPHAAQAIQIVRRRRPLSGKNSSKSSTETVYAVTSLTAT
jgi:hypothetical protein